MTSLVGQVYAWLGDAALMFDWLRKAVEEKSVPVYLALLSYEFRPYDSDPRFHAFLNSIGLSRLAKS